MMGEDVEEDGKGELLNSLGGRAGTGVECLCCVG